jgi:hypothetical protein
MSLPERPPDQLSDGDDAPLLEELFSDNVVLDDGTILDFAEEEAHERRSTDA